MEDTPKAITLPVLYEQQKGHRREMLSAIRRIEEVGNARYETQQTQIEGVRSQTTLRDDRLGRVEQTVELLAAAVAPLTDYIAELKRSDAERAKWRDRIATWVFGSGLLSLIGLIVTIIRWIHG